jgi:hypothetical protein
MLDFAQLVPFAVTLAVLAFMVAGLWMIQIASKGRLMRCPETGGVALVDVDPQQTQNGQVIQKAVVQCDLWPNKQGCAQGCLARYPETSPELGEVRLQALAPFERL